MDTVRTQHIIRRYSTALQKEIDSWDRIERVANRISESAHLQKPIDLHKSVKFKFEQKFDPERAASLQSEISDLLNAER